MKTVVSNEFLTTVVDNEFNMPTLFKKGLKNYFLFQTGCKQDTDGLILLILFLVMLFLSIKFFLNMESSQC